jgi:hypothetical protein
MNSSGFDNENEIKISLNNKKIEDLNQNLQKLIRDSFNNYGGTIKCSKQAGKNKSDLKINIGNESHTYSIKKGTGNSIHQEAIEDFLKFLDNYSITNQTKNNLRFFIWGDETINGTGQVKNRLSAPKFQKKYPEKVSEIQDFFKNIKEELIQRFVIIGAKSEISAEFIYYGTTHEGTCCKSSKVATWISNNPSNGAINIGRLTFQAWNRNINGGDKSEKKRGVIQLKWGSIKDDIKIIYNEK